MNELPKVVVIRSMSFTGTTWINLVLGCHPQALAIGPPQRAWEAAPEDADGVCVVHNERCTFWPEFIRTWDRDGSFFRQLADYSGKALLVLNNPFAPLFEKELADRDEIDVRTIFVARDGRAVLSSVLRHHPGRYATTYDAIAQWVKPALNRLRNKMVRTEDPLLFRYEEVMRDPQEMLARAGAYLGIEYPANATHYWEFEQHLALGNSGLVDLLRRLQGEPGLLGFESSVRKEYYDELLERTRKEPDRRVVDESWKERLSLQDRFAYDYLCGQLHEYFGYPRDRFTVDETRRCLAEWSLPLDAADAPEEAASSPGEPLPMPQLGGADATAPAASGVDKIRWG